ncbi:hypothetical protein N431DRAFT_454394 [Stipitochalara longipes BDJ]|nr:hypothetical protein N431DRAFT_454394 [Stipitochalara longipes BDJ]
MTASRPKPIHKTPPITRENFQAGYIKPQSYAAEDISKAIIDLVSIDRRYTERQEQGLEKFKNRGSWNLYEPENAHDLWVFFDIFNDVFFNGVLSGHCTMAFFEPRRSYIGTAAFCDTQHPNIVHDPRYRIERPRCHLAIKKQNKSSYKNFSPEVRIRGYQSSLLHEMLHAVFAIYTCFCDGCDEKNRSYVLQGNGHSEPWLAAAHAIEQADKVVFEDHEEEDECGDECIEKHAILGLSLELDLHKNMAVASTVQEGANLPPDADLRRLGIDFMEVWEALQDKRKEEAENHRKEQRKRQLRKSNHCLRDHWIVDSDAVFNEDANEDCVKVTD